MPISIMLAIESDADYGSRYGCRFFYLRVSFAKPVVFVCMLVLYVISKIVKLAC